MTTQLESAILISIAQEGSASDVETLGYTSAQIALALRQMLANGTLLRNGPRFILGPSVTLPEPPKKKWENLDILREYEVERVGPDEQYAIGHQTFTQIKLRVRP